MTDNFNLFSLPFQIILSLGIGFVGYAVCFPAERRRHRDSEITLLTFLFAAFSNSIYQFSLKILGPSDSTAFIILAPLLSLLSTVAIALIWRRFIKQAWTDVVRKMKISNADEIPGAWEKIISDPRYTISQISVRLKSGKILFCSNAVQFDTAPFGPCYFGYDGSVALYVTHSKASNKNNFSIVEEIRDPEFGDRITFIPSDEISEIDLTWK